jgi:two-component system, NtrC family, sensor kinase
MNVPPSHANTAVHILVVDDEPEIAESLSDFLIKKEGYTVMVADNGLDALKLLEKAGGAIDLVLLDMRMPHLSGLEVLARIRMHPQLQYTRVIVLTAASGNQEKVQALSAGADDYITKPYYPQELLARVKTILRSQQLEKQLQHQSQQLAALNRAGHTITTTLESKQVQAAAVEGTLAVLEVELAAIFLIDNKHTHLRCQAWRSRRRDGNGSADNGNADNGSANNGSANPFPPIPLNEGLLSRALSRHSATAFNVPQNDPRHMPDLDIPAGFRLHNLLVTPLVVRNHTVGVLAAYNKHMDSFSDVDVDLFDSLASSVSRAIENAWLFQSIQSRQQELLESRNTLQAVIDGILHPIYTINESWALVAVNQTKTEELMMASETLEAKALAAKALASKTLDSNALASKALASEALTGQTCYTAFFGRQLPCDHCAVAQILAEKQARRWPVRWLGPDHLPQEWVVNAYPIPATKAGAARAVVVWQNRTEERRLENSLMQAGKLAAIGQLAAGVAHEINNPLTVINANAEMLKMFIPPADDNYESVDLIARAGDRATKVVRGLLDFARQAQYDFEPASVNLSIRQALDLVVYQFESANVDVTLDLAQALPEIVASCEHLKSVWLNLFVNARDAVEVLPEGRRIEIASRPAGGHVQVLVRDNGRGMAPAELAHIFEPFYTTKDPGKGTGLGLATCHRIIEQHNGQIEVISSPGEGTTFVVHLPVRSAPPQANPTTHHEPIIAG